MEDCKPVGTPMTTNIKLSKNDDSEKVDESLYKSLIGSLQYLTASKPDILFVVSVLSRFMHSPKESHFIAAKRVLRYIKGTIALGTFFPKTPGEALKLIGYTDNDWGGCIDDSRSTSGYLFSLSSGIFTWSSKKQETTAQFTTEAKYVVVALAVNQAIWLRKMLKDLEHEQAKATRIMCDNISAVSISKNLVCHGRTKHIKIKFHFI
ncbi:secreted RxLR effector protein 161-like [Diospyros lotus]|uniref:secreted RxLR effector protein 161-like n=1 Tax=Diospyros lotus TaxID=55363 RepID=UPI0022593A3A|nr:secreted RxLR effector protein 161-like [Diospyros lotus]